MEPLVTIAIPDLAGSDARGATVNSLARHTPEPYVVVLLGEQQYQTIDGVRYLQVPSPFGTPAALNRLLVQCTTPYVVLLESGAIVTSGWLHRLLAVLADPTAGLSGPSTNISWNEQQIVSARRRQDWSVAQIDAYAGEVAARYRTQTRSLDTLHSLGDFCYLFKRALAEQLGGFDEAYGSGPCWEIDFSTRAARAGFRAIWVCDAYVHRAPPTARHMQAIRRYFTTSKQLYQDRFCGLRLRSTKTTYEVHCRGEACEYFAPHDLIRITLPSQEEASSPLHVGERTSNEYPLISCIMPTRNRRAFVRQALAYFERQDYPNRELIVVDDGEDRIADLLPNDGTVRYIALDQPASIGAKRNIACEQARGSIIAHWDDDDWYAPHRLWHQVRPLLDRQADITGLETSCFFDLTRWQAWTCTPDLHRRLFVGDVHGGTLVYWRRIWENQARYPDTSIAEDALFLRQAIRQGSRLRKQPHARSFVYLRHDSNAWRFPAGTYLQASGWQRADLDVFLPAADLPFYAALSQAAPERLRDGSHIHQRNPLVSCIMPTCNRRAFISQAIRYFLRQDYPHKELIIVDDGSDATGDLVPVDDRIHYIHLSEKSTIGAKRNLACEHCRGEIIAHWDDDDWHAPSRLRYQVEALLRAGVDMCGINTMYFYDTRTGLAWRYSYPAGQRMWLSGSTLCYRRSFWTNHRFENLNVGEDTRFVWKGQPERLTRLADAKFHVGIIHGQNVSPKRTHGPYWQSCQVEEIRQILGDDWPFYQSGQTAMGQPADEV